MQVAAKALRTPSEWKALLLGCVFAHCHTLSRWLPRHQCLKRAGVTVRSKVAFVPSVPASPASCTRLFVRLPPSDNRELSLFAPMAAPVSAPPAPSLVTRVPHFMTGTAQQCPFHIRGSRAFHTSFSRFSPHPTPQQSCYVLAPRHIPHPSMSLSVPSRHSLTPASNVSVLSRPGGCFTVQVCPR